ncbi:hypothetical protein RI054_06g30950 [Pseudoscourfieldia marina]
MAHVVAKRPNENEEPNGGNFAKKLKPVSDAAAASSSKCADINASSVLPSFPEDHPQVFHGLTPRKAGTMPWFPKIPHGVSVRTKKGNVECVRTCEPMAGLWSIYAGYVFHPENSCTVDRELGLISTIGYRNAPEPEVFKYSGVIRFKVPDDGDEAQAVHRVGRSGCKASSDEVVPKLVGEVVETLELPYFVRIGNRSKIALVHDVNYEKDFRRPYLGDVLFRDDTLQGALELDVGPEALVFNDPNAHHKDWLVEEYRDDQEAVQKKKLPCRDQYYWPDNKVGLPIGVDVHSGPAFSLGAYPAELRDMLLKETYGCLQDDKKSRFDEVDTSLAPLEVLPGDMRMMIQLDAGDAREPSVVVAVLARRIDPPKAPEGFDNPKNLTFEQFRWVENQVNTGRRHLCEEDGRI